MQACGYIGKLFDADCTATVFVLLCTHANTNADLSQVSTLVGVLMTKQF